MLARPHALAALALSFGTAPAALAQETRSDTLFTVEKYLDYEQVSDPQISPDGTQIIYTRRYVDKLADRWESALWIMGADGSRNRLTARGIGSSSAARAPAGRRTGRASRTSPTGSRAERRSTSAGWTPRGRRPRYRA
jgi:dipeptidyl aminopeptidase/acylaminoacyl peptidase